jgi:hypothetical protein
MCYSLSRPSFIPSTFLGILITTLLLPPSRAQTVQSVLWAIPDGNEPDLSQTFMAGNTVPLEWNAFEDTFDGIDTQTSLVDLWCTAFDNNPFTQLLTRT